MDSPSPPQLGARPDFPAGAPPPAQDSVARVRALLERARGPVRVRTTGLRGAARGHVLASLSRQLGSPLVCVTADEEAADALAADLSFFLGGGAEGQQSQVVRLPADEALPYDEVAPDDATVAGRLGALFLMARGVRFGALVLSAAALQRRVLPPAVMESLSERITAGQDFDRDALARRLVQMGYRSSPLVEDKGTFSVRGDILDVFPPLYERPVRVEFFGDTVESLRAFDPDTQRTVDPLTELHLSPAREVVLNDETRPRAEATARAAAERLNLPTSQLRERLEAMREGLPTFNLEGLLPGFFEGGLGTVFDAVQDWGERLGARPVYYLDDPLALERAAQELWEHVAASHREAEASQELACAPEALFLRPTELEAALERQGRVLEGGGLALGAADGPDAPVAFSFGSVQELRHEILSHHGEEGALQPLLTRLERWREGALVTVVACGTLGQADRLKRLLQERGVPVRVHAEPFPGSDGVAALHEPNAWAHLFTGEVSEGFVDPGGRLALLADEEIFGVRARRRVRVSKRALDAFSAGFKDLKEGDLIVHTDFGIGRYLGLSKMEVQGVPGDFLLLEYANKDKVYLPVHRMRLIQKWTGGDPTTVQLDRLGTQTWEKTKKRVKEQLLKMAADLLRVIAARQAHPGFAYSAPDRYFHQFEADFAFDETPDQARAIEDVLADMQKPTPMDRLVCGDVGYGKTEVAMRAAFKAALDRKQTAVLVPTTVLAQQHFHSFKKRFKDYPVVVDVLSGLRRPAEVRDIHKRLREGKIDVIVGTHKLVTADTTFKDLGLVIVDEEQRFGVKQKEALKRLRTQVDVLTLTATPIPRTLHMSMSGIRDMSIIATPPSDRRAIRTFVMKFDPKVVKEAVEREVARGGQVFFVHNRVESIHEMERTLRELLPQVSMQVAHGQMHQGELERIMLDFTDRKFQMLISTSIIESGIDIPNANTMIVNRADAFGLAQLYQLRGRVGRSKERAYAYLLVPARRTITRDAQRRLEVLQHFTELGAGFQIASHDLEIRGAGNLLGPDQSGSIAAIGFDLYTQLLEEAVAEMRGEPLREAIEPEVNLPFAALIPDDYVPDVAQRLLFYKRFAQAQSPDEVQDLRAELVDRYGEVPDEVDNLTDVTLLKMDMRDLRLRGLEAGAAGGRVVVTLGGDARLDGQKLAALVQRSRGVYRLTPDLKLVARTPEGARGAALVPEARKVLRDLGACAAPGA